MMTSSTVRAVGALYYSSYFHSPSIGSAETSWVTGTWATGAARRLPAEGSLGLLVEVLFFLPPLLAMIEEQTVLTYLED